ncbi:MAG TPA: methyltransferase domain-containing protein [Actinomycetota bacterium]|nr:methyltransferase domain-containing protein [Actinomycetota bacterium]
MDTLDAFLSWARDEELSGQPDAEAAAGELGHVVRRIADAAGAIDAAVIDIGSGTGAVALAMADRRIPAVAVDVNEDAVARGRAVATRLNAPVTHVAGDATALPFRDASFGGSVHRSVLVYLEDRPRAVAEERRVLAAGAMVSCSESIGAAVDLSTEEPGIAEVWPALREVLTEAAAHALWPSELARLYREAGFTDVRVVTEDRETALDSSAAVVRAFAVPPPAGLSAREYWRRAGLPGEVVDEFLARLAREAELDRPVRLATQEAFLTATAP